MEKTFWVYILANKPGGVLYIGVTSDLVARIYQHKTSATDGFTHQYNVKQLVYFEACLDSLSALVREKNLKNWKRVKKVELVERENPEWRDLYESIL